MRSYGLTGLFLVVVLFGGLVAWAAVTEIAGAVVATGTVVVEERARHVQHHEGGIVLEIHARNGDAVAAGDLLLRLDATEIEANLAIVEAQLRDALATEARLTAEITGARKLAVRDDYVGLLPEGRVAPALLAQERILRARVAAQDARIRQLQAQIVQTEEQIAGLAVQQQAVERQRSIVDEEIEGLKGLLDQGLVESTRVTTLEKQMAELEGTIGAITFEIARTRATIAEREVQIAQLTDEYLNQNLEELQEVRQTITESSQRAVATREALRRVEVRAPWSGIVHESTINTVGGVVAAGSTVMLIVPQEEALVVAARVAPPDIDKIGIGETATLRFSAFDARSTPELFGTVRETSPDLTHDPVTGVPYYLVEIAIGSDELGKLPSETALVPGMPVETFFTTEDRTVLSYLLQPLADQVVLAFREE